MSTREVVMAGSVIVAGARTPIGKLAGALAGFTAMDLGGFAIAAALERAGIAPDQVDYVFMGQVLQAGQGQITARQAATKGGVPMTVPATTVNKVCLSGLNAIHLADLVISAGEADIVVAGGMESMTGAPYLLPGARSGYRLGDQQVVDSMMLDGLYCAFDHCAMGLGTERYAGAVPISRERQDAFSALSHERAANAIKDGRLVDEIVAVSVPQRKGDPVLVEVDEGVRPGTTAESLAGLRPAFDPAGTITAGNASQISDGGAAVIVMSRAKADQLGLAPLGEIAGYGQVAGPDASLLTQPSRAIKAALDRAGLSVSDVDLFEVNEAFAAVAVAAMDDLGISEDVTNVNGGAIALGHPIGMSGTRLALTLLHELRRRGGGLGAASLCGGGGQGDAMLLRATA
jgi:acetyl-CoA C-acetyltransferase